jgi:hypothetical protein
VSQSLLEGHGDEVALETSVLAPLDTAGQQPPDLGRLERIKFTLCVNVPFYYSGS